MPKRIQLTILFFLVVSVLIGVLLLIVSDSPRPDKSVYDGPVMQVKSAAPLLYSSAPASVAAAPSEKININQASAEELTALDGIGETLAQRIIAYRETVHSFERIEDIMNVKGIGTSVFNKIKEGICVSPEKR